MALRVNTRLTSVQAVQGALEAAGIAAVPIGGPGLVLLTPRTVQAVPGLEEGCRAVPDSARAMEAACLPTQHGMRDMAAGGWQDGDTPTILAYGTYINSALTEYAFTHWW